MGGEEIGVGKRCRGGCLLSPPSAIWADALSSSRYGVHRRHNLPGRSPRGEEVTRASFPTTPPGRDGGQKDLRVTEVDAGGGGDVKSPPSQAGPPRRNAAALSSAHSTYPPPSVEREGVRAVRAPSLSPLPIPPPAFFRDPPSPRGTPPLYLLFHRNGELPPVPPSRARVHEGALKRRSRQEWRPVTIYPMVRSPPESCGPARTHRWVR